jgi:hypothetical protein
MFGISMEKLAEDIGHTIVAMIRRPVTVAATVVAVELI